jgi:parvulin-like peptidyl-prolyl isomerase
LTSLLAATVVALLAGCGSSSNDTPAVGGGSQQRSSDRGCLTQKQVDRQVDQIANGIETSDEEVKRKQDAIEAVRQRAC